MCSIVRNLVEQLIAVEVGEPLENGRLKYFRRALAQQPFLATVESFNRVFKFDLFLTLPEVEAMENEARNGISYELIRQCCLILQLSEEVNPGFERWDFSWIYRHCRNLEEVAQMRFELNSYISSSEVEIFVECGLEQAIIVRERISKPTWLELLLLIKVSTPWALWSLHKYLLDSLGDTAAVEIPKAVATILLSSVADFLDSVLDIDGYPIRDDEEKLILTLLERGASLMVTSDGSCVLFEKLKDTLLKGRVLWWKPEGRSSKPQARDRCPSALSKILSRPHTDEFITNLKQYTCCNLDARGIAKVRFGSKLSSLRCLAAHKITESQLPLLPLSFETIVLKHQPISGRDLDDESNQKDLERERHHADEK